MKGLNYQEIYYTSSERGVFSGNAGFGVRTCTREMDSTDVDKIIESCATGYAVYNERILDKERILENPDVVYDYPTTYLLKIVELSDGTLRYVFGRTIYLGVDYGFFKGINAYDRTGTNYFTHLLVFDQEPPCSLIEELVAADKFVPHKYTCTPNNQELVSLLTGQPEFLAPGSIELSNNENYSLTSPTVVLFLQGLLQILKNRQSGAENESHHKMLVKSPTKLVEECLIILSHMPDNCFLHIKFLTNYMQGYGIPDGYDIAFVNEFNEIELYEDNYVTVNLFDSTSINITPNLITGKITELFNNKDYKTAFKLVHYYLNLKDVLDNDLEFYYDLFNGIESEHDISLKELSNDTIKKIPEIRLNSEQESKFWNKINKATNESLTSIQGQEFLDAIDKISLMHQYCPNKVVLEEYTISYVTNILFNGRGNFGKIATEKNIDTITCIVNKDLIPPEAIFLTSLNESTSTTVWEKSIRFYYNDKVAENSEIITAVLDSKLNVNDKNDLILKLYPLTNHANFLFDFIKNSPNCYNKIKEVIVALVKYLGKERASDFVWLGYLNQDLFSIIAPAIRQIYEDEINSNLKNGTTDLFGLFENVGNEQIENLRLWPVLELAAEKYFEQPISSIKMFLDKIDILNIKMTGHDDNIYMLKCLVNREVPMKINRQFVETVYGKYPNEKEYHEKIINGWINKGISKSELSTFINNKKGVLSDEDISFLIMSIWNNREYNTSNREDLILIIIDNCAWKKKDIEDFCIKCGNRELKEYLIKSSGFIDKMMRKISNLIWKGNKLMLFSFLIITFITGCQEPECWINPFKYQYYDCLNGSHVKEFRTSKYDSKRNLVEITKCDFNIYGDLLNLTTIRGTDTIKTSYEYNDKGRLVNIKKYSAIENKIIYTPSGQLTQILLYDKYDRKEPIGSMLFEYDENGRLLTLQYLDDAVGYLLNGDNEDEGGSETFLYKYENEQINWYAYNWDSEKSDVNIHQNFTYGEDSLINSVVFIDPVTDNPIKTYLFTHKIDKTGNWTERTVKSNGKIIETFKRQIAYYSNDEIIDASIPKPTIANTADGKIGELLNPVSVYLSNFRNRLDLQLYQFQGGPVLIAILLILTITGIILTLVRMINRPFFKRKINSSGMKRMWMYDSSRYLNVLSFFLLALLCFLGAILVIALVGGIAWLVAWIIKIFFIIVIWAGIIFTVIGGLGVLGKSEIAGLLIPGILILIFKDRLEEWGEDVVAWSFAFLNRINLIGSGFNLVINLWDIILLVFLTPIAVFLLVALIIILFNTILNAFEWIVTKIYSIRRPCPSCGCTQTPDYIIGGKVHPVKLHPGSYGIFTQLSPTSGKRIPTMLLNGKGKLTRKCPHCGTIINSDTEKSVGTDIHIGFVGHRSSGKSYLLYSGLSSLLKTYPNYISQIDADLDTNIESKKQRIDARQGIQTNVANKYRAVQLIIQSKLRPVPYHIFFYDVAGEKFNASSSSFKTAMDFYKNVQSIVFIVDPTMIDYTGIPANEKIKNWANRSGINNGEKYRIENSFSVLKDILESVGRKSTKIDFSFVCTKADMKYLEEIGKDRNRITEKEIEQFIRIELGLGNLVNSAIASFNTVHFFEISVTEGDDSKVRELFESLMKQRGVNI